MRIAVIDNYDSFVFNLVRYLREMDHLEIIVQRNDAIDYSEIDNCDGILLSPGPGIPNEAGDLMKVVEKYYQSKPIMGICLGHQAIAQFFGAKLVQNERPLHGKSSLIDQTENNELFKHLPATLEVGRYHSWSVQNTVPHLLKTVASTKDGEVMAFEHEQLPLYGVQFHPESILTPFGRIIMANWIKSISTQS